MIVSMLLLRKIKKKAKKPMVIIGVLVSILILSFTYYIIATKPPLLQGNIIYQIPYNHSQSLDVYLPTSNHRAGYPVVIYIHGGAWITGTKEAINFNRFNSAINELREKGYVIISPDYTLARNGKSPFPQCINDMYDAIEWVKGNAATYRFDLDNIGLIGESAGAHLAMMIAFGHPGDFNLSYQTTRFDYLIDIYGPNDMNDLYHMKTMDTLKSLLSKLPPKLHQKLDISQYLFGFDPEKDSLKASIFMQKYSPVTYVHSDVPPTLMIHGQEDILVPVSQSETLHQLLDTLGIENKFYLMEGVDHAFRGASDAQKDSVQSWITSFILSHP